MNQGSKVLLSAMLGSLLASLREELQSTEMFISCFYGVVDRARGELHYANTGHPHAFVIAHELRLVRNVDQILVLEDMLGLSPRVPKFVRRFGSLASHIEGAVRDYAEEVRARISTGRSSASSRPTRRSSPRGRHCTSGSRRAG